jgi:F0F1-type ATP synthase assembly protein I
MALEDEGGHNKPVETDPNKRNSTRETAQSIGALSTVGLSFVLAIVIGAWFGYLLDKWLGTGPWLFLLFFILGFVGGALNAYRMANRFIR